MRCAAESVTVDLACAMGSIVLGDEEGGGGKELGREHGRMEMSTCVAEGVTVDVSCGMPIRALGDEEGRGGFMGMGQWE